METFLMPSRVSLYPKLTVQAPAAGVGADQQVDLRQAQETIWKKDTADVGLPFFVSSKGINGTKKG